MRIAKVHHGKLRDEVYVILAVNIGNGVTFGTVDDNLGMFFSALESLYSNKIHTGKTAKPPRTFSCQSFRMSDDFFGNVVSVKTVGIIFTAGSGIAEGAMVIVDN